MNAFDTDVFSEILLGNAAYTSRLSLIPADQQSNLSKALVDHPLLLGDARETIIRGILTRILPSVFEIGCGQIVDSTGNTSNQIDIVIVIAPFYHGLHLADLERSPTAAWSY